MDSLLPNMIITTPHRSMKLFPLAISTTFMLTATVVTSGSNRSSKKIIFGRHFPTTHSSVLMRLPLSDTPKYDGDRDIPTQSSFSDTIHHSYMIRPSGVRIGMLNPYPPTPVMKTTTGTTTTVPLTNPYRRPPLPLFIFSNPQIPTINPMIPHSLPTKWITLSPTY